MQDDAEIIRRYLGEKSQEAFAELVERHLKVVYYAALRQVNGDTHLAEDVAQIVFSKLAAKSPALRNRTSLVGWLYVTTRYEAARAARSERRRRTRETKVHIMQEILKGPAEPVEWEQLRPLIDGVLCGLNDRERELVLLRYFEGISYPEIAGRLGVTADAARQRLDRTLEKIRGRLAKQGYRSTATALGVALGAQASMAAPGGLSVAVATAAFTAPAAGGSTFACILEIMNTSKIVVAATVIAGAIGIGLSLREHSIAGQAQTEVLTLNQQNESLSSQIDAMGRKEESLKREVAAGRAGSSQGATGQPVASAPTTAAVARPKTLAAKPAGTANQSAVNRELSNNPAIRAGLASWITACQTVSQGPLFKSLGLTGDQIDSLNALELQFNINMGDNILTLRPEGATMGDVTQSIHTLLGDAGYQQYVAYQPTQFVREVASSLAGNLFDSDTPLTSDQADQLTQILAQNSTAPKGAPPFPGQINWTEALAQAQAVLTPAQVAVLSNLATVIGSQPGVWGSINPSSPGATGRSPGPPSGFYASDPAAK